MLIPFCDIVVGALRVRSVVSVDIQSSWQNLTDTCTIELPRNSTFKGQDISTVIQRGQPVKVILGYEGYPSNIAFEGFVRDISADVPFKIDCEDAMYKLKRIPATSKSQPNAFANTTTSALAQRLVGGAFLVKTDNINIGSYRITEETVAKELRKMKEKYGLSSWFKGNTLHIGLPYSLTTPMQNIPTYNYHLQKNVPYGGADLDFKQIEELQIKGIVIYPNGKQKTVEVGDATGDSRTLHYYNTPEAEVKKLLEHELQRLKAGGMKGSFKAFGYPAPRHGEIVQIKDELYPERSGSFYIDKVATNFGLNGYRITITIGPKLK